MGSNRRDALHAVLAALAMPWMPGAVLATTRHVPSEYHTIQAGIDAAAFGDTVLVAPGEYSDYVTRPLPGYGLQTAMGFLKDGVVVRGEGGAEATVLRHAPGPTLGASALIGYGLISEQTAVEGFTVESDLATREGVATLEGRGLRVRGCVFRGLDAVAVYDYLPMNPNELEVTDCRFESCHELGGIQKGAGVLRLTRCTFVDCSESAVSLTGSRPTDYAEIRECVFQDCSLGPIGGGGGGALAIAHYVAGVVIDRCVFTGNTSGGTGGAVTIVGGGPARVSDCVFRDNQAQGLGGSILISGAAEVSGNTFFNSVVLDPSEGGGAAVFFVNVYQGQFHNNIIASTHGAPAVATLISAVTSGCNDFWDNVDGIGFNYTMGATDRIADPLFCDPTSADFRLMEGSPCLPENSAGCGLIGALGQGCGTVSVEPQSWGRIKAAYLRQ